MTAKLFVDTNVLVYTADGGEVVKRARALAVLDAAWQRGGCVVSTQVLQEYFVNVTRKVPTPLSPEEAEQAMRKLTTLTVIGIDARSVLGAIARSRRRQMSLWDALIVQSAVESACTVLLTEDLSHGEVIDGVRVVDPFQGDEDEVLALFG